MKQTTWHWPDHVIGKRESRRLREEHNELANSHYELLLIAEQVMNLTLDENDPCHIAIWQEAKLAITKAKEMGHE